MHDVPRASRMRRRREDDPELARSGLLGTAVATDEAPSSSRRDAARRWRPETRPSDAVTAECTCPVACIRDHEHE